MTTVAVPIMLLLAGTARGGPCGTGSFWCNRHALCVPYELRPICAAPPAGCARWFNGCEACDAGADGNFPCASLQCHAVVDPHCMARTVPQEAIPPSLWVDAPPRQPLRVEIVAAEKGDNIAYSVALRLPSCMFLTALYGSEEYPLVLPAALDVGAGGGSAVQPGFAGTQFAAVGIDLQQWSGVQGVVIDNGAWFTLPDTSEGPAEWEPSVRLARIVLPPRTEETMTFNVQLTTCLATTTRRVVGIVAHLWNPFLAAH